MKSKCDLCQLTVSSEALLNEHLAGKKHLLRQEEKIRMENLSLRSIYINNFTHPINSEELATELGQFGEVGRVVLDKSGKNAFAIVEFKEADAAQNLLHSIQRMKIGKSLVRIQPRRVDFAGNTAQLFHTTEHQSRISPVEVLDCLHLVAPGITAQLVALIDKFAISNENIEQRAQFARQLQQFLQRFFASTIHIRVFGSSATGLGFTNSDLDLNMVFDEDLRDSENGSSSSSSSAVGSPASSLNLQMQQEDHNPAAMDLDVDVQLTPENLASNPMHMAAFNHLSKMNRVRLLNRLVNAFRKEQGLVTAHVPVPDARTPVVRLLLRTPKLLPCELSVQNLLSECKANIVRDLVRAETTGRLWRFLFLLKLWASATGLFSPEAKSEHKPKKKKGTTIEDEAEQSEEKQNHQQQQKGSNPKSHWNSYTLSLCAIAYLQNQQQSRVIPPIGQLIRPNSRKINGWAVEYDLPFFRLEQEIPSLLRGFFTFLYQQIKEDRVLCLREGKVLEAKEFREKYADQMPKWRFSAVNVQDPLELSHNVGANVSKESVGRLRWKIMYAISMIKRSSDDLLPLFQLDSVKKLQTERKQEKEHNRAMPRAKATAAANADRLGQGEEKQEEDKEQEGMEVDE